MDPPLQLESNSSSAEWTAKHESQTKRPETERYAGKIMASVSGDVRDIVVITYLENHQ